MEPRLYRAAMEGKVEMLAQFDPLNQGQAPNGNTVLHIAAQYGRNEWIHELFTHMDSSSVATLLRTVNSKAESALHVAAREGHSLVIKSLVEQAENASTVVREILTSINEDGDTALHLALRSSIVSRRHDVDRAKPALQNEGGTNSSVLTRTITKGKDWVAGEGSVMRTPTSKGIMTASAIDTVVKLIFPNFAYPANKAGETTLYLAAECECHQLVTKIAETVGRGEPAAGVHHGGPGGRSALHAAVISNNEENTKFLLNWKTDFAREPDTLGWTPIHCAAEFGHAERVRQLLEVDESLACLPTTEEDGKNTALHIAARRGCVSVIEELVSVSAGCWEMVNARGQNALHVAIEHEQQKVIQFFEQSPSLGSLINQKDIDGNTPVHLAARGCRAIDLSKISQARLLKMSFNNENRTPLDLLASSDRGSKGQKKEIREGLIKAGLSPVSRNAIAIVSGKRKKGHRKKKTKKARVDVQKKTEMISVVKQEDPEPTESDEEYYFSGDRETTLIVAALVATVTFTAGITVPGGFNGNEGPNQGAAMLLKLASFQAFVVADTLALMLSTLAILYYFVKVSTSDQDELEEAYQRVSRITYFSVLGMVMAFITGTYSVLSHLPSLAVPLCVATSVYFGLIVFSYEITIYHRDTVVEIPW